MFTRRSKKSGFTLIELIMVIVILAVLAATAIPKFISLKEEASKSAGHGVTAALQGAVSAIYAEYLVNGTTLNYTLQDVINRAQISGIGASVIAANTLTATIGGRVFIWTWTSPSTASTAPYPAGAVFESSGF